MIHIRLHYIIVTECPLIASINDGSVTVNDNIEGGTAEFSCDPNYELVGANIIKCEASGQWDAAYPECLLSMYNNSILCRVN
jgi:hypothetical protein